MVSDKYLVNSETGHMAAIQQATEAFAKALKLDRHSILRLGLLAEETLGMVKAMVEEFYDQLWFSGDAGRCEVHLQATAAKLDAGRRKKLISASSSGRNASAKGFMALLGGVIADALYGAGKAMDTYGTETIRSGLAGAGPVDPLPGLNDMTPLWTLSNYKKVISRELGADEDAERAWDELEKSIVASLADEVIVGVKNDRIELVIVKDFGR